MPADFFPKREADIREWSGNFSARINSPDAPTKYGVPVERAIEYATLQQSFASLYQMSQSNSTRTASVVAAKNTARIELENATRLLVRIIRGNPTITVEDRVSLRIALRNPGGPRGRHWTQSFPKGMEFAPRLSVVEVNALRVKLRVRDRQSPMNMSLPKGVMSATIVYATGDLPPALGDRDHWKFLCISSRTVFEVAFEGNRGLTATGGKLKRARALPPFAKVWFAAFWNGRRAFRSAWCEPVYTHLGYGLALAA